MTIRYSVSRAQRHALRAFTLIELLAVIAMIGALAAATAPSIIYYLRDRRVADAGSQIANLYRFARARSMGRGSAVNVRYQNSPTALNMLNPLDPDARVAVREAIAAGLEDGSGGAAADRTGFLSAENANQNQLGIPNCRGTNWDAGEDGTHYLGSMDERRSRYYPAVTSFKDFSGGPLDMGSIDVCFTPRGRMFWSNQATGGFVEMFGVPYIEIQNSETDGADMIRKIIIPPNGAARLITEIDSP